MNIRDIADKVRTEYEAWYQKNDSNKIKSINKLLPCILTASAIGNETILKSFSAEYKKLFNKDSVEFGSSDIIKAIANKEDLTKYYDKYTHAHIVNVINFGKVLYGLANWPKRYIPHENIEKILTALQDQKITNDVIENLSIDDLELHALLNQYGNFFHIMQGYISDKEKTRVADISDFGRNLYELAENEARTGIKITFGAEIEQTLMNQNRQLNDNQKIKLALSDLNHRRAMQMRYKSESNIPEVKAVSHFYQSVNEDKKETSPALQKIEEHAASFINSQDALLFLQRYNEITGKNLTNIQEFKHILFREIGNNLLSEEVYIYHLLFLNQASSNLLVEGINDAPENKKAQQMIDNICQIAAGNFYSKIIDMIQAVEMSTKPIAVTDFPRYYNDNLRALQQMQELDILLRNVQLNFGAKVNNENAFKLEYKDGKLQSNLLTKKLAESIKKALENCEEIPGIWRNQKEIEIAIDRKKGGLLITLQGTDYLAEGASNDPAFLQHKFIAAKNATIRISRLDDGIGIIEVRLIGCNPHFAWTTEGDLDPKDDYRNIAPVILNEITKEVNQFLSPLSKEDIDKLVNTPVTITANGKFEENDQATPMDIDIVEEQNPTQTTFSDQVEKLTKRRKMEESVSQCHY